MIVGIQEELVNSSKLDQVYRAILSAKIFLSLVEIPVGPISKFSQATERTAIC